MCAWQLKAIFKIIRVRASGGTWRVKEEEKIFESISSNWTGLKVLVSFEEKGPEGRSDYALERIHNRFKLWLGVSGSQIQQRKKGA